MANDASPKPPRGKLPERIGRYRIIRRIGGGGMGVVYEAHDDVMDRIVALKVLMADFEGDAEALARFHREAQAAARLVHPNIITIFDAGEDRGRSFIAMQLLDGRSLADYMGTPEATSLERKVDLMVQICEGLTAAHGQGVIHRDLKPNNLFVQADGLVKIYDFGVARLAESNMTAVGTMIGTPDYMSPEQARGAQIDARSDIFSAGAVFYFILTGKKPFPGPEMPAVLHQLQVSEPAPIAPSVAPPELSGLVMRAMAKDPADRPPRIEELLAGLVRVRRQYQAETRRLSASVRARFEALEKLTAAVHANVAESGLTNVDPLVTPAERFPALSGPGAGLDAFATDRTKLTALLHDLDGERHRLTSLLEVRRAHAAQLDTGRGLLASGDAIGALRQFELVAALYPSCALPRDLAEGCRADAREQEARNRRLSDLTDAARRAIDAGEFEAAVIDCKEALALAPRHQLATTLRAEAENAITRERRRQEAALQRVVDRASRAIDQRDFDLAAKCLREAEELRPEVPAVRDLRQRLTLAEAAAEAALLLEQMSFDEVRRARGTFRRGRQDEAVQQLRAFLEAEPEAEHVIAELSRLVRLRERLAAAATARQARAAALMASARALGDEQVPQAIALIRDALRLSPTDAAAATLFSEMTDRDLAQRLAAVRGETLRQRVADAEPILAAAREAYRRGYLHVALEAALTACRMAPDVREPAQFVDELRREMTTEDVELVTLADAALAEPVSEPAPVEPRTPPRPPESGVLAQVNQWASDLLRRRTAKS